MKHILIIGANDQDRSNPTELVVKADLENLF